jgi:exonuclease SbcC
VRTVGEAQLAPRLLARVTHYNRANRVRLAELDVELAALPMGYDAVRHAQLRAELSRLVPVQREAEKLRLEIERGGSLRGELDDVRLNQATAGDRERSLRASQLEHAFSEQAFEEARREFEAADEGGRKADLASVGAEGELARAREASDAALRAAADREERQRTLDTLMERRRLQDELDRAYSDLRSDLNAQMRPELSDIASGLMAELTDGRYSELELDSDYNIIVHEEGVAKPVISGGEEDLANLVLRLAISQMIAERAGQPLSLLVLDEIFGSLDDARRLNVLELLRKLHDRFEQVILITHIDSVRDALDRVITVRYDASSGTSVVERGMLVGARARDAQSPGEYSGEAAD